MKRFLLLVFFLSTGGCVSIAALDEMMDNKYLDAVPFPATESSYVGAWTADAAGGLVAIRINADGTGKICSTSLTGNIMKLNSKTYKTSNGDLFLINESGLRFKINSFSEKEINTTSYGNDYRFIPGVHSSNCKDFIGKSP